MPVTSAPSPTAPTAQRATTPRRSSSSRGGAATDVLATQAPATRNGAVKYRPAHSQNATWPWLNFSQCTTVAMPSRVANSATAGKPSLTAAQRRSRSTQTKNQNPPR